ncbi:hypothetical protein [Rhodococcus sp. SGAir0479]|uniref:hypothetical protein n=1 Tax=Rhodococcus sp. SGAir0479 TaxID=2567884 RepID=UPI0010CCB876|nr:hypothetical protein [Rhodococcus sp. SGAir0479]QCQ91028.1 hypothetical protein E7742_07090 [Rhodococcus sp. SGAir0479]
MATTFRRAAAATTAVAGLALAGAGVAGAANVIPGDTDPGRTIITSQPGVTVTIDTVDRATGAVTGTLVNQSGMNLNCTSPNPNPGLQRGGTVSAATVIRDSLDHYTRFQSDQAGAINAGSNIFLVGRAGVDIPFWPLLQLLPSGSLAGSLSDGTAESAEIANAHQDAKMRGLVGELATFTVNNGVTRPWSTTLSPAAIGERGKDQLGAIFVCRVGADTGQHYAWVGYEGGAAPAPVDDTGSLASSSAGTPEALTGSAAPGSTGSAGE